MPTDAFAENAEILENKPNARTEGELSLNVILGRIKEYFEAQGLYARLLVTGGYNELKVRSDVLSSGVQYYFLTRLFEGQILVNYRDELVNPPEAGKFLEAELSPDGFVQQATIEAIITDIAKRTGFDPVQLLLAVTDGEIIDAQPSEEPHLIR